MSAELGSRGLRGSISVARDLMVGHHLTLFCDSFGITTDQRDCESVTRDSLAQSDDVASDAASSTSVARGRKISIRLWLVSC